MEASVVTLSLKLEAATKKDNNQWVAHCVPLDVLSQGDTEKKALKALEEAVHLWFESCMERDVLSEALAEAGFTKIKAGEKVPKGANIVAMQIHEPTNRRAWSLSPKFIKVEIPAYIAAAHLDGGICAAR